MRYIKIGIDYLSKDARVCQKANIYLMNDKLYAKHANGELVPVNYINGAIPFWECEKEHHFSYIIWIKKENLNRIIEFPIDLIQYMEENMNFIGAEGRKLIFEANYPKHFDVLDVFFKELKSLGIIYEKYWINVRKEKSNLKHLIDESKCPNPSYESLLESSFRFKDTKEGLDYWYSVVNILGK